ncbi:MAG: Unknown protein [uncultured Sulfurovum sp.]|uniref:Uncharacterized protein n=1 Tax=uncultured Sulfurovum sp. TaxID=269237 RepID=A0A6S6SXE6_9BACT|nr:MAG: Unknown protein [uncultured Sulfurovum sp.]
MYTVKVAHECGCFKKSEYESEKSFETQRDAYNYSNILAELMNEDFCTKHAFSSNIAGENTFVISVSENPNAGSCGTGDSSCSTGSCGC